MGSNLTSTAGLFDGCSAAVCRLEPLAPGAVVLRGFAAEISPALIKALDAILERAPFRHMVTPGGFRMSVAMTNCGEVGWVTEPSGYRYDRKDPTTQQPWPAMPEEFRQLATRAAAAAGFNGYVSDSCLINRYEPGARLSLHQDRNERSNTAPIVSVSLGLPATFMFGGATRNAPYQKILLESGDIAVWGGPSRMAYHGVAALADGYHSLTGRNRINLTFRRALSD